MAAQQNLVGQQLGAYELIRKLGQGGMGAVYVGRHRTLHVERAIKVLLPTETDKAVIERFHREGIISASLRHPNIVGVLDVGEEQGVHFLVMDLVEGRSLLEVIRADGALTLDRAIQMLRQVADALDYAHARGVVHRDIKPSNIIVGPDGHVTLVDFGIARALDESRLTHAGVVVGTFEYMAPEVVTEGGGSPAADGYSLGIVAYQLIVGRVPFTGQSAHTIMYRHVHEPPPPPRSLRPDLPEAVERVLLRQLAKPPEDRYPSTRAFVDALTEAAAETTTESAAPSLGPPTLPSDAERPTPSRGRPPLPRPSRSGERPSAATLTPPPAPPISTPRPATFPGAAAPTGGRAVPRAADSAAPVQGPVPASSLTPTLGAIPTRGTAPAGEPATVDKENPPPWPMAGRGAQVSGPVSVDGQPMPTTEPSPVRLVGILFLLAILFGVAAVVLVPSLHDAVVTPLRDAIDSRLNPAPTPAALLGTAVPSAGTTGPSGAAGAGTSAASAPTSAPAPVGAPPVVATAAPRTAAPTATAAPPTAAPTPAPPTATALPPTPRPADRLQDARAATASGDYPRALELLASLRQSDPGLDGLDRTEYDARVGYGRALLDRGELDPSWSQFDQAQKLLPGDSAASDGKNQVILAKNYAAMESVWGKDDEAAIALLEQNMVIDPGYRETRSKLYALLISKADRLLNASDRDGAYSVLMRALEVVPDGPEARQRLASYTPTPTPPPPPAYSPPSTAQPSYTQPSQPRTTAPSQPSQPSTTAPPPRGPIPP